MKLSKPLKVSIFLVPVLVGAYLIFRQFWRTKQALPGNYVPPNTPQPTVTPVRTPTQISSGCNFPLKQGVYNCDIVKQLQWALNNIPISKYAIPERATNRPLTEDGDFGPKTAEMLYAYNGGDISIYDFVTTVENQDEFNNILADVVTDPVQFQAAENPYIIPNTPAPATTPIYFPKIGG